MLLAQKYAPSKIEDIAGNEEVRTRIKQWMLNWLRGVRARPLLINGPTGTGKTSIAYALSREYDLELIEMGASDVRDNSAVERVLQSASSSLSLSGKSKLMLIDDVDALQSKDRGGASAIVSVLKNARVPVLLTATDVWDKKLAGIRAECQLMDLRRISKSSVKKVLMRIASAEKLEIPEEKIEAIAGGCEGDVRSAINDLQTGLSGLRDRERDMFDRVRTIFKSTSYSEAREAGWGDVEHDFLKLWVDENAPLEYEKIEDLAPAYNFISRSDIFDGRIKNRQYWGFLRYSGDLLTAGVALAKKEKYFRFVKYQFPSYLRQMSALSSRRAMLKGIGHKIGARTHSGWREALNYAHVLKHILSSNSEAMNFYQFEEEEAAFLLEIPVSELKEKFKLEDKKAKKEPEEKPEKEKKAEKPSPKEEKKSEPKKEKPAPKTSTLGDFL